MGSTSKQHAIHSPLTLRYGRMSIIVYEPGYIYRRKRVCRYSLADNTYVLQVTLDGMELWQEFSKYGNEMITSSRGRHMFPVIKVYKPITRTRPDANELPRRSGARGKKKVDQAKYSISS